MNTLDILMLASLACIWLLLLINVVLIIAGYRYYFTCEKTKLRPLMAFPKVSVLVPAHNEDKVIAQTIGALLRFDYPKDRYEIIVVNDNSSDNTAKVLNEIKWKNPDRNLTIITTDETTGGKGKSNALNIAFAQSDGTYITVYDADNTPEASALRYLVTEISGDDKLGAVIGKFRTRNKNINMLTRFINIETLAFQWMAQAGRWRLFALCTIPGTNYIIRRSVLEQIGGWDVKALAEDTEISYNIYMMGYYIKFLPQAVTWEQEPQSLPVWFRQRARWVRGNAYVLIKNIPMFFKKRASKVRIDIIYFLSIYFLLLISLIISDVVLIGSAIGWLHTTLAQFSMLLWIMAITLFVIGTFVTITTEKGELNFSNLVIIVLMYFTYSKLWMVVTLYGLIRYVGDIVSKREIKWTKTVRY